MNRKDIWNERKESFDFSSPWLTIAALSLCIIIPMGWWAVEKWRDRPKIKNVTPEGFEIEGGKDGEMVEWIAEGPREKDAAHRYDPPLDSELWKKPPLSDRAIPLGMMTSSRFVPVGYINMARECEMVPAHAVTIEPARTITGEPYVCTNCMVVKGCKDEKTDNTTEASDSGRPDGLFDLSDK